MRDDFQLFQDEEGGDPDIALITAYLARELSLVQIVAVEERLATDGAFREKVKPVIEAWALPGSLAGKRRLAAPAGETSLTRTEIEQGWQRYVAERVEVAPGAPSRPIRLQATTFTGRKRSMTRIAAGIAAVVLPVVTLAQAAMYAAKHQDAPGHAVAKRIVAPFVADVPAPPAQRETTRPLPPADARLGRELEKAPESVQRAPETTAIVPSAGPTPVAVPAPVTQSVRAFVPDRARIAGFATKYHANIVRGDTAADYMVMVLDAGGNYVWSTYGSGTVSIQVAGDKRTAAERAQFTRDNRVEYTGTAGGSFGGGGGGGGGRGGMTVGVGGGAAGAIRAISTDSAARLRGDSSGARAAVRSGGGGAGGAVSAFGGAGIMVRDSSARSAGMGRVDSASGNMVAAARIAPTGTGGTWISGPGTDSSSNVYRVGWGRVANGQVPRINEAPGLQEPGGVQSGIQGLMAASITAGETYMFAPGQLSPRLLRIAVFHLAPGTTWNGR